MPTSPFGSHGAVLLVWDFLEVGVEWVCFRRVRQVVTNIKVYQINLLLLSWGFVPGRWIQNITFTDMSFFTFSPSLPLSFSRYGWTQVPRYFSHMESVWGVSQPSAVITNTTIIAISETLCHAPKRTTSRSSHTASAHTPRQTNHIHWNVRRKLPLVRWLPEGMAGMDRENTLIQPHLEEKPSLPCFSHSRTHHHIHSHTHTHST